MGDKLNWQDTYAKLKNFGFSVSDVRIESGDDYGLDDEFVTRLDIDTPYRVSEGPLSASAMIQANGKLGLIARHSTNRLSGLDFLFEPPTSLNIVAPRTGAHVEPGKVYDDILSFAEAASNLPHVEDYYEYARRNADALSDFQKANGLVVRTRNDCVRALQIPSYLNGSVYSILKWQDAVGFTDDQLDAEKSLDFMYRSYEAYLDSVETRLRSGEQFIGQYSSIRSFEWAKQELIENAIDGSYEVDYMYDKSSQDIQDGEPSNVDDESFLL